MFDDEGWYRTGDVGVLDDDGYLTITDRVSDIIIRGGENISAQEVEEQLLRLPAVAEVAVVAAPDDRLGERAAAIVRLLPGRAPHRPSRTCGPTSPRSAWPSRSGRSRSTTVADLPRTPSGKVQKFKLRQQLREGSLEHAVPSD